MVGSPAHRLAERNTDSRISDMVLVVQVVQLRLADPVQNKTGFKLGIGQQHPNYQAIFLHMCVCVCGFFLYHPTMHQPQAQTYLTSATKT